MQERPWRLRFRFLPIPPYQLDRRQPRNVITLGIRTGGEERAKVERRQNTAALKADAGGSEASALWRAVRVARVPRRQRCGGRREGLSWAGPCTGLRKEIANFAPA